MTRDGRCDPSRVHWDTSVNELAILIGLNGYLVGHVLLQLSLLGILDEFGASPLACGYDLRQWMSTLAHVLRER